MPNPFIDRNTQGVVTVLGNEVSSIRTKDRKRRRKIAKMVEGGNSLVNEVRSPNDCCMPVDKIDSFIDHPGNRCDLRIGSRTFRVILNGEVQKIGFVQRLKDLGRWKITTKKGAALPPMTLYYLFVAIFICMLCFAAFYANWGDWDGGQLSRRKQGFAAIVQVIESVIGKWGWVAIGAITICSFLVNLVASMSKNPSVVYQQIRSE